MSAGGTRLALDDARVVGETIVRAWSPHTERAALAGSIRRRCATVGDVELVVIPKWRTVPAAQPSLFATGEPERRNLLAAAVRELAAQDPRVEILKPGCSEAIPWRIDDDGKYWRLRIAGVRVDVFLVTASTWGLNLMIRTGSGVGPDGSPETGFGPAMLRRWKVLSGGKSVGAQLVDRFGKIHPTPEEQDVFDALQMPWIPPWQRIDARAVPEVR